jgi:SAM-dependent methyltransferase
LTGASETPWYERAFRADYRLVYPHRDLESAAREVAWLLEQDLEGRVLDLCCGFGRHTLALAEAGLDVVGVDLSMDLLRGAPEALAGRLIRGDATRVPLADAAFDGLVVLFSSFGYFGDEGDGRMLDEVARLVRPGGRLVLDLMNPERIRAGLIPHSVRREEGFELEERRALADGGRRVQKDVELRLAGGEVRRWREDVRMYACDEMRALLEARGVGVEAVRGDFADEAYGAGSPRMILLARRYTRPT